MRQCAAVAKNINLRLCQQGLAQGKHPRSGLRLRLVSPRIIGIVSAPMDRNFLAIGNDVINASTQCFTNPHPKIQKPMDKQGVTITCVRIPPWVVWRVRICNAQ